MTHKQPRGTVTFKPAIGHIVLVKEPSSPRSYWKYGVIEKLDKRQALAYVRSKGKLLIRAINQLYPIEIPLEEHHPSLVPTTKIN